MTDCVQELCPNWSGDGRVCPCAVLDLTPPSPCQVLGEHDDNYYQGRVCRRCRSVPEGGGDA